MADNITLPGTSAVVATEDIGGVEYQRFKQVDGRTGSTYPAGVRDDFNVMTAIEDLAIAIQVVLERIENPIMMDQSSGRMRVMLDPIGGAQTLGTITTVSTVTTCSTVTTVTNLAQIGAVKADSLIYDTMHNAWAGAVLPSIQ